MPKLLEPYDLIKHFLSFLLFKCFLFNGNNIKVYHILERLRFSDYSLKFYENFFFEIFIVIDPLNRKLIENT